MKICLYSDILMSWTFFARDASSYISCCLKKCLCAQNHHILVSNFSHLFYCDYCLPNDILIFSTSSLNNQVVGVCSLLESIFLLVYTVEIAIRFVADGVACLKSPWVRFPRPVRLTHRRGEGEAVESRYLSQTWEGPFLDCVGRKI